MNKNKENFINEYKALCKKYNLMIKPDEMAALVLESLDEEILENDIQETISLDEYYSEQKHKNASDAFLKYWKERI